MEQNGSLMKIIGAGFIMLGIYALSSYGIVTDALYLVLLSVLSGGAYLFALYRLSAKSAASETTGNDIKPDARSKVREKANLDRRIQRIGGGDRRAFFKEGRSKEIKKLETQMERFLSISTDPESIDKAKLQLLQAGYYNDNAATYYYFVKVFGPIVLLVLGGLIAYFTMENTINIILTAFGPALLIGIMADMQLAGKAKERIQRIAYDFPEALELMLICIETGTTVEAAIELIAFELGERSPDLVQELEILQMELRMLPERNMAYKRLSLRAPIPAIQNWGFIMYQNDKYGTAIGPAMRLLAEETRAERELAAEKKAGRLPVMITIPLVFGILPPLLMIIGGPAVISIMDNLGGRF